METFAFSGFMKLFGDNFHAGIVNPLYTCGLKIGYIRYTFSSNEDPQNLMRNRHMAPVFGTGIASEWDAFNNVWAPVMQYINSFNVDHIIIDHRGPVSVFGNIAPIVSLRNFFGTDDTVVLDATNMYNRSPGQRTPSSPYNGENFGPVPERKWTVSPSRTEAAYPGSVFTGGDVFIFVDERHSEFKKIFLGPNGDKNLGGITRVKIIGSSSTTAKYPRRFSSISNVNPDLQATRTGVKDEDVKISFLTEITGSVNLGPDGEFIPKRSPNTAPDSLTGLLGLSGSSSLPFDEESLYSDLGLTSNTRPRLSGDTRVVQPVNGNKLTWRDSWIEETVREACLVKRRKISPPTTFVEKVLADRVQQQREAERINSRTVSSTSIPTCTDPQSTLSPFYNASVSDIMMYDPLAIDSAGSSTVLGDYLKILKQKIALGYICMDGNDVLCVTQNCGAIPKLGFLGQYDFSNIAYNTTK